MSDGHIVYSSGQVADTDGEINYDHHTYVIFFANKVDNWVEVKLNGGPRSVWIPPSTQYGGYTEVYGDYTKFEVVTASSSVAVFAVG